MSLIQALPVPTPGRIAYAYCLRTEVSRSYLGPGRLHLLLDKSPVLAPGRVVYVYSIALNTHIAAPQPRPHRLCLFGSTEVSCSYTGPDRLRLVNR